MVIYHLSTLLFFFFLDYAFCIHLYDLGCVWFKGLYIRNKNQSHCYCLVDRFLEHYYGIFFFEQRDSNSNASTEARTHHLPYTGKGLITLLIRKLIL